MSNTPARKMRDESFTLSLTEKQILYYRTHPVQAAKDLLNVDLIWLQRIALRNMFFCRFPLLNMGRGVGKSWLMAVAILLIAILYPRTKIGIIAPVFRQANYVFDHMDEIYMNSDFLKSATVKASSRGAAQSLLRFHNGAFIEALPLGDGNKIRGRRYHVACLDEYAQIDETVIKLVIRPMLNVKRGNRDNKLIVASTAYYRWNHYWTLYLFYIKKMLEGDPDYRISEFDYIDVQNTPNSPYKIDEEIIEMQKNDMTVEEFMMENRGLFPSETVGFISAKLIDQCTPKIDIIEPEFIQPDDDNNYVMGVDAARQAGGDNFALVVLKMDGDKRKVVYVETLNGKTFQEMANTIRNVLENFNIVRLHIGAGGGGLTIKDLLAEQWFNKDRQKMLPILDMEDKAHEGKDGIFLIKMVNESARRNNELYMNLKAEMQHKRLLFPVDVRTTERDAKKIQETYNEILSLKRELMVLEAQPSGVYHKFVVPPKYKKDRATALVMALDAALDINKADKIEEMGELPLGIWV